MRYRIVIWILLKYRQKQHMKTSFDIEWTEILSRQCQTFLQSKKITNGTHFQKKKTKPWSPQGQTSFKRKFLNFENSKNQLQKDKNNCMLLFLDQASGNEISNMYWISWLSNLVKKNIFLSYWSFSRDLPFMFSLMRRACEHAGGMD